MTHWPNPVFLGLFLLVSLTPAVVSCASAPPIFRGTSGQFIFLRPVKPAPKTAIAGLDGTVTDLGRFRGKVVVLNFWATWCAPCAYEMPSLDRLAAAEDPGRLTVLAVSIDRKGSAVIAPFIALHHLTHLSIYLDPDQRLGSTNSANSATDALPLWGLPISYIIDREGQVLGYLAGTAEWDSQAARAFLDYFVKEKASR